MLGTSDWTLVEVPITVTTAGTARVYLQLGNPGNATGTVEFANVHMVASVSNTHLGPDSVTTDKILANTILAGDILLTGGLSALSANLGTISAGTITGATFQTAASGARVTINASGMTAVDGSANTTFSINSSGAVSIVGSLYAKTGLTIDSGTSSTPPTQNRLRFLDASSNGITELQSWAVSGSSVTNMLARAVGRSDASAFMLSHAASGSQATLTVQDGAGAPNGHILLKSNGQSCFVHAAARDGSASQNMGISTQGSVAYSVAAGGVSSYTLSPPSGVAWTIVGHTTGTSSWAVDWGMDGSVISFYNRGIGTVTGTFYYQYISY
jgi:hypothetical protein